MRLISCFSCSQDNEIVEWTFDGVSIVKKFEAKVYAECFKEKDGVIVVIRSKSRSPNNAIILNPDGTERVTVVNPMGKNSAFGFSDVYYVKDNLTLINTSNLSQFSCVVNKDGEILSTSEIR